MVEFIYIIWVLVLFAGANRLSVGGGNSNFGGNVSFQSSTTFNNEILVNSRGRIYQQGNANFS